MRKSNGSTGVLERHPWVPPVLIVLLAGALTAAVIINQSGSGDDGLDRGAPTSSGQTGPTEADQPDLSSIEARDSGDVLAAGPVDAPVGLVVFSDYQCPYCAQWNHDTLPAMMDYAESGDLRIEWRDVHFFNPSFTDRASRASYAAGMQDRFWEYHDALFPGGELRDESELERDALIKLAEELGLDTEQFAQDLDSDLTAEQIQTHAELGTQIGVSSTPAFILGGEPILGAQPTEVFIEAMDNALELDGR